MAINAGIFKFMERKEYRTFNKFHKNFDPFFGQFFILKNDGYFLVTILIFLFDQFFIRKLGLSIIIIIYTLHDSINT